MSKALPVIFAGLKLAAGTTLLLLVAAEVIADKEDLGAFALWRSYVNNKIDGRRVDTVSSERTFNHELNWIEKKVAD